MRWSAASTSTITARRRSSERESSSAAALRPANLSRGRGGPTLGVLHLGRGFNQSRRQPGPIGANGVDLSLDRPALLFRRAQRVFDPAELNLLIRALVVGRRGRGRRDGVRGRAPRRAK